MSMMVRLDEHVRIHVAGDDGIIECAGHPTLNIPGEGASLETLAALVRTPRQVSWLRAAMTYNHPNSATSDLVGHLIEAGVLIPWPLGMRLAELHLRTTDAGAYPLVSPAYEMERILREAHRPDALDLPPPTNIMLSLDTVLSLRRTCRRFIQRSISQQDMATILALGAGIGATPEPPLPLVWGGPPAGRAYPSGGALYPVEVIVYPMNVASIAPGFYYYQVLSHQLAPCAPPPSLGIEPLLGESPASGASLLLLLYVDFARPSLGKYGEKAYRLALLEAGHMAQNVILVGAGLGLGGLPICGFADEALSRAATLAFPHEAIIYILALGIPAASGPE